MRIGVPPALRLRPVLPRSRVCLLALVFTQTASTHAAIFQLDDTSPYISIGGSPVQWHSGTASQWMLSSLLVRVHPRGVMFKPGEWHPRDLTGLGWASEPCIPSLHGLCETESSVAFPVNTPPFVGQDSVDWCAGSDNTLRTVTNASRYDTSACDVLDADGDYIFRDSTIRRAQTELPAWIYWTICVLVVYLVRCLSKFILASLDRRRQGRPDSGSTHPNLKPPQPAHTVNVQPVSPPACLLACAACVLLIVSQGDSCFITEEDLLFHWFTVFYTGAYGALFIGARIARLFRQASANDPPFYNLLAGVLQLVASRLYVGAETPYNPPLVFVVAVRALVKSRRRVDLLRCLTLLLDAWMLALMCALGFAPDGLYLLAVFAGAGAWGDFLV